MSIYFTADPHYYHRNVIKYCNRPFSSVEEMNEKLISNWNKVVKPEDDVYVLGDFSLAFRPVELYTKRLMGNKFLVPGNHDFCHSYHKKSNTIEKQTKWIDKYWDHGWNVLPERTTLEISDKLTVQLCHHPYYFNEEGHDKYAKWRPIDSGGWLLCGHVHEKWKVRGKVINVGVDVWNYAPVNEKEIKTIIGGYETK